MEIEEGQIDGTTILYLKGEFFMCPEELLRERVQRLVKAGSRRIALDLTGVPYLDGAGVGEIVRCYTIVSRHGGKFKLLNIGKRIRDFLSTTGVLEILIGDDTDDWPSRVTDIASRQSKESNQSDVRKN